MLRTSIATLLLAFLPTAASAQTTDSKIFNAGLHAGRVGWASKNCRGSISPTFDQASAIFMTMNAEVFQMGMMQGMLEQIDASKEFGVEKTCLITKLLYGPSGVNVPNAWNGR